MTDGARAASMQSTESDAQEVRARLRQQAMEIKTEELNEALSTLDYDERLTDTERAITAEMANAIVTELLTPAETALEHPPDDREIARIVASLFDLRDDPWEGSEP